jgi:predicted site-specific integrase-resolvase
MNINITQAAEYLGLSVKTLQRLDRQKKLISNRTTTNEIIILNQEKLSPEAEMVQDLMTIIHCFSSRLYGLRNYKKQLKKALNDSKS